MKYGQKLQNILILLFLLALLIPAMSCAKEKKQRVSRSDPSSEDTMTEEDSKEVVVIPGNQTTSGNPSNQTTSTTSSSKNSASVFYGTWEREAGGAYTYEVFGSASKKGDVYEGTVTNNSNQVIANYKVYKDNTVEIAYFPGWYSGVAYNFKYKVSDGGNKITLDSSPPIVYTKGKSNTTIQTDAAKLSSGNWIEAGDPSKTLGFSGAKQSGAGWTGIYAFLTSGTIDDEGTFTITKAGEITLASSYSGGSDKFTYSIRNSDKILDLNLPRKGTQTTYSR